MNLVFNDLWGVETALIDENQSFGFAHTIWSLSELCCFDLIFSHFSAHSRHSAARQRSSESRPRRVRPSRGSDAGSKTISLRKKRIRKFSFSHLTFKHWRLGFTSLFVHCVCGLKQSLQPSLTWIMNCYQQDRGIERTSQTQEIRANIPSDDKVTVFSEPFPIKEDLLSWRSLTTIVSGDIWGGGWSRTNELLKRQTGHYNPTSHNPGLVADNL